MKYLYGDSWEKYPIKQGEQWKEANGSILSIADIFNGIPGYMYAADMLYADPPWNTGNITCFFTKAGKKNTHVFTEFAEEVFAFVEKMKDKPCYLEIGKQNLSLYLEKMNSIFPCVQFWEITYYKKHPCYLVRGGNSPVDFNFTGYDDVDTPTCAIQAEGEKIQSVADICMGQGLTAVAAYNNNKLFYGTELNKRRIAVTIDKICKLGGQFEKR